MKRNVFEGFRRIRLIFQIIWVLGALAISWEGRTYVSETFNTIGPRFGFYHTDDSRGCSSPDKPEFTDYTTKDGHKVSLTLCFRAMKFKNGAMLVPYRVDVVNEDTVWGADAYSTDVTSYTAKRKDEFRPTDEDDEWLSKRYRSERFDKYMNGIYIAGGGAIGLWVLAYVIGWIMRGFLGVPRGQDHRPAA